MSIIADSLASSGGWRIAGNNGLGTLSERERAVVRCVADGLTNHGIAEQLGLSEHTVKNYMFRIFDKLGVSSRVELVLYYLSPEIPENDPSETEVDDEENPPEGPNALEWYRKAAKRGSLLAQLKLGQMHCDSSTLPQDPISAYMWFLIAERTCESRTTSIREAKDQLARKLKAEQIGEAERRAAEWSKNNPQQTL